MLLLLSESLLCNNLWPPDILRVRDESLRRNRIVHVYLVDLEHIGWLGSQLGAEKPLDVKSVFGIMVGKVFVHRMLGDVVFLGLENSSANCETVLPSITPRNIRLTIGAATSSKIHCWRSCG